MNDGTVLNNDLDSEIVTFNESGDFMKELYDGSKLSVSSEISTYNYKERRNVVEETTKKTEFAQAPSWKTTLEDVLIIAQTLNALEKTVDSKTNINFRAESLFETITIKNSPKSKSDSLFLFFNNFRLKKMDFLAKNEEAAYLMDFSSENIAGCSFKSKKLPVEIAYTQKTIFKETFINLEYTTDPFIVPKIQKLCTDYINYLSPTGPTPKKIYNSLLGNFQSKKAKNSYEGNYWYTHFNGTEISVSTQVDLDTFTTGDLVQKYYNNNKYVGGTSSPAANTATNSTTIERVVSTEAIFKGNVCATTVYKEFWTEGDIFWKSEIVDGTRTTFYPNASYVYFYINETSGYKRNNGSVFLLHNAGSLADLKLFYENGDQYVKGCKKITPLSGDAFSVFIDEPQENNYNSKENCVNGQFIYKGQPCYFQFEFGRVGAFNYDEEVYVNSACKKVCNRDCEQKETCFESVSVRTHDLGSCVVKTPEEIKYVLKSCTVITGYDIANEKLERCDKFFNGFSFLREVKLDGSIVIHKKHFVQSVLNFMYSKENPSLKGNYICDPYSNTVDAKDNRCYNGFKLFNGQCIDVTEGCNSYDKFGKCVWCSDQFINEDRYTILVYFDLGKCITFPNGNVSQADDQTKNLNYDGDYKYFNLILNFPLAGNSVKN